MNAADRALAGALAARMGLENPVRVRALAEREIHGRADGRERAASYIGRDTFTGAHIVALAPTRRGMDRARSLAHEVAHAAQCERVAAGSHARYMGAYARAGARAGGYRANPYERAARAAERGDALADALAECGAELESDDNYAWTAAREG